MDRNKHDPASTAQGLETSALHLAAIVESSEDAIISKQLDGPITSWNRAAEHLFGYSAEEMIGSSILRIIPDERRNEEADIIEKLARGERIANFETVRRRKDGNCIPVSLTISPVRLADGTIIGASKIARDISRRKASEALLAKQAERFAILNRVSAAINADLDLERILQTVTDEATAISGARFGAFFYNALDEEGDAMMLYTLARAPRAAFEKFAMPRKTAVFAPTFDGQSIVRSDDIREDPRYGCNAPHRGMPHGHLPVASYLAVPVRASSGDVLGSLLFGHHETGVFSSETESLIAGIASQAGVAIENARLHEEANREIGRRQEAEATKDLLLHELKHRLKNTMAMVQALASQTLRNTPREEQETFLKRLHALSAAHDLLTAHDWETVSLDALTERALAPFREAAPGRITASGPEALLPSREALALKLSLHELATNAVKYGALSNATGEVSLSWSFPDPAEPSCLRLVWAERGGPTVSPPEHRGFGSRMIAAALKGRKGKAQFDYAPDGLVVTIHLEVKECQET